MQLCPFCHYSSMLSLWVSSLWNQRSWILSALFSEPTKLMFVSEARPTVSVVLSYCSSLWNFILNLMNPMKIKYRKLNKTNKLIINNWNFNAWYEQSASSTTLAHCTIFAYFLLLKCIAIYDSLKPKKSATMMRTLSGLWMRILTAKIDIRTSSNFYTNFIISWTFWTVWTVELYNK